MEITKRSQFSRWMPVSAALAGVAMASFFHLRQQSASRDENPVPASLNLRAEPDGSNVRIEWDPRSPLIEGATGGAIDVAEGNSRKALRLNVDDLRTGYVEWRSESFETTFAMRINRPGGVSATGQVRFVNSLHPINSSSDSPNPKPPAQARASASPGGVKPSVHAQLRRPLEAAPEMATNAHKHSRARRVFSGITTKASHLWPFHSAKPAQQTQ